MQFGIEQILLSPLGGLHMRSKLLLLALLSVLLTALPGSAASTVQRRRVQHSQVHRRVRHRVYRRADHRYYIRHRTKWQHAKIIGKGAKTGASVGGMIGGPPGMAAGAAVGAGAGTAYDLKTRKVKVRPKVKS
jgi:hypothetical protein